MILGILEVDSRHSTITFKIIITGIGSKMAAIYGTGFNTYYWYDMITDIPNAYFVEVGIYKYVSSPTYTLGKLYKINNNLINFEKAGEQALELHSYQEAYRCLELHS